MKIRFEDTDSQYDFLCMSDANAAIAIHMGMEAHEAIKRSDGIIELVKNGKGIIIPFQNQDLYVGWNATIYPDERIYFVIEGE